MSGNKMCYHLKCVARAATLQEAPSRLRLSVRQPRRGCLPWCSKKRTVATFCFKGAHWQQGPSGEYEQTAEYAVKDLAKLKRLAADLPIKVKYWTKGRPSKLFLQASLGTLLDQLEGSPAFEAWLAFTATGQEQRVCWQPAEHQDGAGADPPLSDDIVGDSADKPLGYDELWDSEGEETPVEEDLAPKTPDPCVAEDGEGDDGEWVTFFNPSTGRTLRLPRHTKEEAAWWWRGTWALTSKNDLWHIEEAKAKWRGPGASTSEDDLLSLRALRIVEGIQPVVKRSRLPEGPHWWKQTNVGIAAAVVTHPAEQAKQQDTNKLPPYWNLPTFPGSSAVPCRSGGTKATPPEVSLPDPRRRGEAGVGLPDVAPPAQRRRGGAAKGSKVRWRPFLTIVAALAYMIFVPWLVTRGDNFLDAIRTGGWLDVDVAE